MATGLTRFHNTQRGDRKVRKFTGHELMAPNIKVACGIVLCSLRGGKHFHNIPQEHGLQSGFCLK
uniref:Transposase n=1 Tax=Anguilla anguilla TaxID=7936 RepID=A0A0E9RAR0_ANGAN